MTTNSEAQKIDSQVAELYKKTAQAFREYFVSGDARTEAELISVLNGKFFLFEKFFLMQNSKIEKELAVEQLREISKDRKAVIALHQSMYMTTIHGLQNILIYRLEIGLNKQSFEYFQKTNANIEFYIVNSQRELDIRLNEQENQARIDFKGHSEFLEIMLKKHKMIINSSMLSTEKLLDARLISLKNFT